MSQVFALGAKIMCNNIAGLVNYQRQLCRENPDVMVSIGKGAKLGVEECQRQFKDQRWNCSTVARDVSVFGKVMRRGKKSSRNPSSLFFIKRLSEFRTMETYNYSATRKAEAAVTDGETERIKSGNVISYIR